MDRSTSASASVSRFDPCVVVAVMVDGSQLRCLVHQTNGCLFGQWIHPGLFTVLMFTSAHMALQLLPSSSIFVGRESKKKEKKKRKQIKLHSVNVYEELYNDLLGQGDHAATASYLKIC